jgi:hypothetical protein
MAEISRRALLSRAVVLGGLAAGAGLGLTRGVRHKVAVPPPPPPAALTDALARQQRLLAGYRVLGDDPARPALAALHSDVVAHGDALHALLERYPGWRLAQSGAGSSGSGSSGSATPGTATPGTATPGSAAPVPGTVAGLAAASAADARALTEAAQSWPAAEAHAAEVVPTLASIAAGLASHAQVLG